MRYRSVIILICMILLSGCGEQESERNKARARSLEELNETCIFAEEKEVYMESENNGEAKLIVKIPDYEELYRKAGETPDPETYIKESLINGKYSVQTMEINAVVTMENGEQKIHKQEAIDKLLEQAMLDAVNAVAEEE